MSPETGEVLKGWESLAFTLGQAVDNIPRSGGVGVSMPVARQGVVVVDFDNVRDPETGELTDLGREGFRRFSGTYVEVSPSGAGLRVVALGIKTTTKQQSKKTEAGEKVEVYATGEKRWLRMTGAAIRQDAQVGECQSGIDWACRVVSEGWPLSGAMQRRSPDNDGNKAAGSASKSGSGGCPWEALAQYRGTDGKTPDEVRASIEKTVREKTSGALAQAVRKLREGGEKSEDDSFLVCEAVRRGIGIPEDVGPLLQALAGAGAREKLRRSDYIKRTADDAARRVLADIESGNPRGLSRRTWVALPAPAASEVAQIARVGEAAAAELERLGRSFVVGRGGRIEATPGNFALALLADPATRSAFQFNEHRQHIERASGLTSIDPNASSEAGRITDADAAHLRAWAHRVYGMKLTKDDAWEGVLMAALAKKVDPVRDALLSLSWDRVPRLDSWLVDHLLVDDAGREEYVKAAGHCFFVGAVRRALRPGSKADEVLCVEGRGGGGKSTAFETIADVLGGGLFCDSVHDVTNSQHRLEMVEGALIVEIAELSGFRRAADQEALKAALSAKVDKVRKPYAREPIEVPRRYVFVATTNREQYIADPSGALARRFWPVRSLSTEARQIDMHRLRREAPQLWAEAVAAFNEGKPNHIEPGTEAFRQWVGERDQRQESMPYADEIAEWKEKLAAGTGAVYDYAQGIRLNDFGRAIGLDSDKLRDDQGMQRKLMDAMRAAGFQATKYTKRGAYWTLVDGALSGFPIR